ncbi:hypothetical protein L195_g039733, partial [Trifolium pratense]
MATPPPLESSPPITVHDHTKSFLTISLVLFVMATQMLSLHFQALSQVPASPSSLPSSVFSTPPLSSNGTLTKMVKDHNTALSVVAL